jgi:hypothetical protein
MTQEAERLQRVEAELERIREAQRRDEDTRLAPPQPPRPSQLATSIAAKQEARRRLRQPPGPLGIGGCCVSGWLRLLLARGE